MVKYNRRNSQVSNLVDRYNKKAFISFVDIKLFIFLSVFIFKSLIAVFNSNNFIK